MKIEGVKSFFIGDSLELGSIGAGNGRGRARVRFFTTVGLDVMGGRDGGDDDAEIDGDPREGTTFAEPIPLTADDGLGSNLELGPQDRAA